MRVDVALGMVVVVGVLDGTRVLVGVLVGVLLGTRVLVGVFGEEGFINTGITSNADRSRLTFASRAGKSVGCPESEGVVV